MALQTVDPKKVLTYVRSPHELHSYVNLCPMVILKFKHSCRCCLSHL